LDFWPNFVFWTKFSIFVKNLVKISIFFRHCFASLFFLIFHTDFLDVSPFNFFLTLFSYFFRKYFLKFSLLARHQKMWFWVDDAFGCNFMHGGLFYIFIFSKFRIGFRNWRNSKGRKFNFGQKWPFRHKQRIFGQNRDYYFHRFGHNLFFNFANFVV